MLSVNVSGMVWTAVNLLVLYLLLKKFLFHPVTAMIESRQEALHRDLEQAESQRIQAEQARTEYEEKLSQAGDEAQTLVAQGRARGQGEYQRLLAQAQTEAQALMARTQTQMESDRAAMLAGARKEVATLALLAAAQVSGHTLTGADDQALLSDFLVEEGERP